jgi:oligopeptide transport system ATP-binding protein
LARRRAVNDNILLQVENLVVHFPAPRAAFQRAEVIRAVDGVSFAVPRGSTMGLVGESGCGKSTTGFAAMMLVRPTSGRVIFDGVDLTSLGGRQLRQLRRQLQMVFQDSAASLNPRMPIGDIIAEALNIHGLHTGRERPARLRQLLDQVGLASHLMERYPHELSGGQAQRVAICRALAVEPRLIICDEPVSALDVSIQAQIVNLLKDLQRELGLTYLFISHDLNVVQHMSDQVAVMYLGKIVEFAAKAVVYKNPAHPYTQALLSAVPIADPDIEAARRRIILAGDLPNPMNPPSGCRFRTRCPIAEPDCATIDPPPHKLGGDHWASCIHLS